MIVTAVEQKPRRRRVHVFVDGEFVLALGARLATEHGVVPGRELSRAEILALKEAEARRGALESAVRLLSYRARSERELGDRLARKGFARPAIDAALERLLELGYLDDAAFARLWTKNRQTTGPRSRRLLTVELRRQGVAQSAAEEATADVSDEEAAYDATRRRMKALRGLEYARFRERLGSFLTRRGFGYDVARGVIERCWAELEEEETEVPRS